MLNRLATGLQGVYRRIPFEALLTAMGRIACLDQQQLVIHLDASPAAIRAALPALQHRSTRKSLA